MTDRGARRGLRPQAQGAVRAEHGPAVQPQPGTGQTGQLRTAQRRVSPLASIGIRVGISLLTLVVTVVAVELEAGGYRDTAGGRVGWLDAVYYATVSLSTTGYGDITPVTPHARLVNILLITPARVLFLIVLVGTTLQVLTTRSRDEIRERVWRAKLKQHTVICGYGTTGLSAVRTLMAQGTPAEQIVVVDSSAPAVGEANDSGLTGVVGDVTRTSVLQRADIGDAGSVVVCVDRDDTAVLTVLTVRQLNTRAHVVAAARESENAPLLRQAGADVVLTTADSAGRLLGLATTSPHVVAVVNDLISTGEGLDLVERAVSPEEVGTGAGQLSDVVVGVVRDGTPLPSGTVRRATLQAGDRVVCIVGQGPEGTREEGRR